MGGNRPRHQASESQLEEASANAGKPLNIDGPCGVPSKLAAIEVRSQCLRILLRFRVQGLGKQRCQVPTSSNNNFMRPPIPRREILKSVAVGSTAFLPLSFLETTSLAKPQAAANHSSTTAARGWAPRFFNEAENNLVTTVSELIIPETDSPGAKAAEVNKHMDLVLSEETPQVQQSFREGLKALDRTSNKLYGSNFVGLAYDQQVAILTRISNSDNTPTADEKAHNFFLDIRTRTVFAYYTSRIGLQEELHYQGKHPLPGWTGCLHPEHQTDAE